MVPLQLVVTRSHISAMAPCRALHNTVHLLSDQQLTLFSYDCSRVKTIQAQLCEKDAMIKVLQKHSLSRAGSLSSLLCSPIHSPRPSITTPMSPLASRQNSQLDRTSSPVHSKSGKWWKTASSQSQRLRPHSHQGRPEKEMIYCSTF